MKLFQATITPITLLGTVQILTQGNNTDWLAPVDKSEVLEKLSSFNPKLLAVIK